MLQKDNSPARLDRFESGARGARMYRPSFRENKPKALVFNDWKRAFLLIFAKTGSNSGSGKALIRS